MKKTHDAIKSLNKYLRIQVKNRSELIPPYRVDVVREIVESPLDSEYKRLFPDGVRSKK